MDCFVSSSRVVLTLGGSRAKRCKTKGEWQCRTRMCLRAKTETLPSLEKEKPSRTLAEKIKDAKARRTVVVENVKAFAIGSAAGLVGSLIGAGGGIILTPLLTSVLRLSQHQAHGTALVAVAMSSFLGTMAYAKGGSVSFVVALIMCAAAVFTARLGAMQSQKCDPENLRSFFGAFLFVLAAFLQLQTVLTMTSAKKATVTYLVLSTSKIIILLGAGSATGYVSGLLGIGGGTLMVPILTLIVGLPQKLAQGTALAAMVFPAMIGCVTYVSQGCIQIGVLPGLLMGVSVGAFFGGTFALELSETILRLLCGGIFVLSGCKLLGVQMPFQKEAYVEVTEVSSFEEMSEPHPRKYIWDTFVLDVDDVESDHMGGGI